MHIFSYLSFKSLPSAENESTGAYSNRAQRNKKREWVKGKGDFFVPLRPLFATLGCQTFTTQLDCQTFNTHRND
jgi:hypothetical protein